MLLLPLLVSLTSCWHRDRDDPFHITLHAQSSGAESQRLVFPERVPGLRKEVYFRNVPEITQDHITGFYPFRDSDSSTWGCVFELSQTGAQRLLTSSVQSVGSYMVVKLDGRTVERLYVSKPVRDGLLVVWSGIPEASLALFEEGMVRLRSEPAGVGTTSETGVNLDASGYGGWDPIRR